ncbi:hypothetical protein DPEC_G00331850 [Dallia pectoralis]|uniref:Uncharacterized protein n=1 Tax=Dallia pectoralis TaxID=75939 RepID=A0ACC2F5X3_DALPE|nr:hypothetical protein DPEC_G00331850 [Dallia pectoralis]
MVDLMYQRQSTVLLLVFCSLCTCVLTQCEEGWRLYEEKCYYFSQYAKSWDEARLDCEVRDSNLMSILDFNERKWVRTQIGTAIFWIGLNDIVVEGVWEWTDGSPFLSFLADWRTGNPDNWMGNENCGQVVGGDGGKWNDENCDSKRNYICKRPDPNLPPMCDTANDWKLFGSNCYKLKTNSRKNWLGARLDCLREGADLVSITTPEEEQYVTGRLENNLDLWLGFSTLKCTKTSCQVDVNNTDFNWSDASPRNYFNWGTDPPQPDLSEKANGICSAMIIDEGQDFGKWRSNACRHERPFMCKRGLNTICPPGWVSFTGSCYWVVSNKALLTSWHEAQTKCQTLGAYLVTVKSQEEQFFINAFLPDLNEGEVPDVWIGVSDMGKDGTFTWVDNTAVEFGNWKSGYPKDTTLWDCGQIYTGDFSGKWETTNCFKSMAYICKMLGGQNVKPTSIPDSYCDTGYLLYEDFCYHFETEKVADWQAAEAYCSGQSGHLASFHSQEELSFMTAHMPAASWIGLSDSQTEGHWVWSDNTASDFLPWAPGQPDNWQGEENCAHVRGIDSPTPGLINDEFCTVTMDFVCKKAKGKGPPPRPPTSGPGWNAMCGSWIADPFNDYCYLFNYLSMRNWIDARADCVNQGGDLISITERFEQAFIQTQVQQAPTGVSVWMGGHDSVTEGGWEWTDGSPFRFINWNAGNPDDYANEDCLSMLINSGLWNDDNCDYNRGYICKRRGKTPVPPPPHDGFETAYICEESSAVLHCDFNSTINIQSAFYGRKSDKICPHQEGATGTCTINGILTEVRKMCEGQRFCFLYAHVEADPCPNIYKYMEVVYSCEPHVCLESLGLAQGGTIPDTRFSASSSIGSGNDPTSGRLDSNSCWMPSSSENSWIQVNLDVAKKVTGVLIQGCKGADHWVTEYKIRHSVDGNQWTDYTADGGVLPGSVDRNSHETYLLGTPVSAQYVQIFPQKWNGQAGLRFDLLGCSPDYAVSCNSKPYFDVSNDRKTVHCPAGCASKPYTVYGSTIYEGNSHICAAAIHAGVILNEMGGDCTMLKEPAQSIYPGSKRNGITTKQYSGYSSGAYQFADGELRCSGPDWYEFGEFCYKPFGEKKTWHAARHECRNVGGDLVSIQSMTEQSWLESYLYMATNDVWIGLNDLEHQGQYSWSDNQWVTFTYWAPGEPNNHLGFKEDCVEMLYHTGRWNDVPCAELNTYICKKPKAHYPVPSAMPTVYGCLQGWDAYGYSCYWMEETARTWLDAKDFCEQQNSKLLHIGDIYEQSHFTVRLSGYTGLWWIGLKAHGESGGVDYIWDNGAPLTFTHWDRYQPDTYAGTCVGMTTGPMGGFWDDKSCNDEYPFVCEVPRPDITPPTPPPTPPPAQGCFDGWTAEPHFRNCYKLFTVDVTKKKSWPAAREDCTSRGADLVSIHNMEEEIFLSTHTKGITKWIGLKHNPIEGGYHWSDGTPVSHTNWGNGEPNNHEDREDCVEMVTNSAGTSSWWNDINCDSHENWICMIVKGKPPILPPVPPPPIPAPDCGTNPGWRKNGDICYYYNDTDIVDFHTAILRCYDEKAQLVSISNKDEQAYVNSMIGTGQAESSWIGMQAFGIAGDQFQWLDWSPVTFVFWGPGEPNNANGEEQCVQMNRHRGNWNDVNCARTNAGYLCKKYPGSHHTPPTPTQPWTGYCPEGWMLFRNKCFRFKGHKQEKANWSIARSWCQNQKAELAVIDNQYENDFVSSHLRELHWPAWIGLTDSLVEGGFGWSDGVSPVLYTNWGDKEPNNHEGKEHCAAMTHNYLVSGLWNDDMCSTEQSWVCSMKKSSSIAPPPPPQHPCLFGYTAWYKNCYKLVEDPKTWNAAQAACEKDGGNLASIDMSYDQAFVAGAVLQGKTDAWIGLRRTDKSTFQWIDGWPVFFTHWGPGEPSNHQAVGCVTMHGNRFFHGTWNDTDCNSAKPYICKISSEPPPPTPAPGDGQCPPDWASLGRYCYYIYNNNPGYSWPEARFYCQQKKADLVSIHSRAEVEFLIKMNHSRLHNIWIGLTRDKNFGWSWSDLHSLAFLNWAPNEPNEAFHPGDVIGENCVEMYPDGLWNDNNCVKKRGFACRHRQYYTTDGDGIVIPTDPPSISSAGLIAGAVIGAIIVFAMIVGVLYYIFTIKGVKLSAPSLPSRMGKTVDVPAFNNPNFGGESET